MVCAESNTDTNNSSGVVKSSSIFAWGIAASSREKTSAARRCLSDSVSLGIPEQVTSARLVSVIIFEAVTPLRNSSSLLAVAALVACSCVTVETPAPKLPFDEAMGWSETQTRVKSAPLEDPNASEALATAMRSLSQASRAQRTSVVRGAPMTPSHLEAWASALNEVERYTATAPRSGSVLDTVRTRLQLETEFETDGSTYGDIPVALGDRVQLVLRALQDKLAAQTASARKKALAWKLQWPVAPVFVTSAYGERLHPIVGEYRFHAGADLAAEADQSVFAAEAGVVIFSGWNGGHGKQVEVQHDGHLTTRYSHLDSLIVHDGQHVKRGELLGLAGQTGLATGVHVHFEVRRDGEAVDPEFALDSSHAYAVGAVGAAR